MKRYKYLEVWTQRDEEGRYRVVAVPASAPDTIVITPRGYSLNDAVDKALELNVETEDDGR